MPEPIPDLIIVVHEPAGSSEYPAARQAFADAILENVLQGITIPEGLAAPRLSFVDEIPQPFGPAEHATSLEKLRQFRARTEPMSEPIPDKVETLLERATAEVMEKLQRGPVELKVGGKIVAVFEKPAGSLIDSGIKIPDGISLSDPFCLPAKIGLPDEYVKALQEFSDRKAADEPFPRFVYSTAAELKTVPNHLLPTFTEEDFASLSPEQLAAMERGLEAARGAGFVEPAQSTPRDDMAETWNEIILDAAANGSDLNDLAGDVELGGEG